MDKYVIIVAGGSGQRMETKVPKQFLILRHRPILMHTIRAFHDYDPSIKIIVVIPEKNMYLWNKLCRDFFFDIDHDIAPGGLNRFQSVKNGLAKIFTDGIVAIHDGVRPLVDHQLIDLCFTTAFNKGNAIPAIPVKDSMRKLGDGEANTPVDRSEFVNIQTPQTFKVEPLKDAYRNAPHENFTDDATVLESAGGQIHLVTGADNNLKITTPVDIKIAETILKMRS